ncbi:hypothetical protein PSTT_00107 [Puccinia striiformis]|uniref:DUF659 domain-containing protein n=1 Tax=Puccinia striiformis TaxID=27350 RepID=A0A2S4W8E3_9BASI|nr:hypothetical protein PSTT_00107 [Puccinia striiformis]
MARSSQKRRHARSSTGSPISSPPAQSQEPSQQRRRINQTIVDDSDNEPPASDIEGTTPGSTQKSNRVEISDEQALRKAQRLHQNQLSANYTYFDTPQMSNQVAKNSRKMIAFPCKTCGKHISRPTHDSSTANLSKHVATCLKKRQDEAESQKLVALGVSGTGDIDPRKVPQLCAIWCAEGARPFSALGERAHRGILHLIVLKNLPPRKAVSRDIDKLYLAVQETFIEELKHHKGAMYLGLDAWQSPNGYDVLGTVIYRLVKGEEGGFQLEAVPLDFVRLKESHTGLYLAETVRLIVEKFGVQDKICGIVTDNASNNLTMIEEIKFFVILRPFGSHKKKGVTGSTHDDVDSDEDDLDAGDVEDQIHVTNDEREDYENEDDIDVGSELASDHIHDDEIELETEDVNELSDEEDDDKYTSLSCKATLAKF